MNKFLLKLPTTSWGRELWGHGKIISSAPRISSSVKSHEMYDTSSKLK